MTYDKVDPGSIKAYTSYEHTIKVPITTSGEDFRSYQHAKAYMWFWLPSVLKAPPLPRTLLAGNYDPCPEGCTEGDDPVAELVDHTTLFSSLAFFHNVTLMST